MNDSNNSKKKHLVFFVAGSLVAISPFGTWFASIINFCYVFIHESGHAFFALFAGVDHVLISVSPAQTYIWGNFDPLTRVTYSTGGLVFMIAFSLFILAFLWLLSRSDYWKQEITYHYGKKSLLFHGSVLFNWIMVIDVFANAVPANVGGHFSDGNTIIRYLISDEFADLVTISQDNYGLLYIFFLLTVGVMILSLWLIYANLIANVVYSIFRFIEIRVNHYSDR